VKSGMYLHSDLLSVITVPVLVNIADCEGLRGYTSHSVSFKGNLPFLILWIGRLYKHKMLYIFSSHYTLALEASVYVSLSATVEVDRKEGTSHTTL
jgi:hypothetical protein